MSTITDDEVRRIARLARIRLTDGEVTYYREDLSRIVDYAARLDALDLDGVEPTTHALDLDSRLRADVVDQRLSTAEVLANAPETEADHFRVPKVVE